jgi:hypothetical protein
VVYGLESAGVIFEIPARVEKGKTLKQTMVEMDHQPPSTVIWR